MAASETTIRLDRVSKSFGEFTAVRELSLDVRAGRVFGLLGPNGAGKTTTIRMIVNITAPDSGSITLFDRASEQSDGSRIRRRDVHDHAYSRGLACAVRTEQSEHSSGTHVEAEFSYRRELPKTFAHAVESYRRLTRCHFLYVFAPLREIIPAQTNRCGFCIARRSPSDTYLNHVTPAAFS